MVNEPFTQVALKLDNGLVYVSSPFSPLTEAGQGEFEGREDM